MRNNVRASCQCKRAEGGRLPCGISKIGWALLLGGLGPLRSAFTILRFYQIVPLLRRGYAKPSAMKEALHQKYASVLCEQESKLFKGGLIDYIRVTRGDNRSLD